MGNILQQMIKLIARDIKASINHVENLVVSNRKGFKKRIQFEYKRMLGHGTFGVVVLIRDTLEDKFYALKRIYVDKRFYDGELECRLVLDHPNISHMHYFYYYELKNNVKVYSQDLWETKRCGVSDGRKIFLNIINEYYPYVFSDLTQQFALDNFRMLLRQTLVAIDYIHSKGFAHRDLKPQNMLYDKKKGIIISDLGSCKLIRDEGEQRIYICSRYHRAPELLANVEKYTKAIDIWSLGCVFVGVIIDDVLFMGKNTKDQLNKIIDLCGCSTYDSKIFKIQPKQSMGIRKFLKQYIVDENLIDLLSSCLEINPARRKTAKELLQMRYLAPYPFRF